MYEVVQLETIVVFLHAVAHGVFSIITLAILWLMCMMVVLTTSQDPNIASVYLLAIPKPPQPTTRFTRRTGLA